MNELAPDGGRGGFCSVERIGRDQLWAPLRQACDAALAARGAFVLVVRGGADLADAALLHPEERQRSARLWHARDRANFALGRTLVQHLVRAPGAAGPVLLALGAHGKPFIAGGTHFNLAHSGDFVACAVCAVAGIGIDIETFERLGSAEELFARIANAAEAAVRDAAPAAQRRSLFERCWTRKEAALKAAGLGLSVDPRRLDVEPGSASPVIAYPAALRLVDLDLHPWPLAGALALAPGVQELHVRLLDMDG